MINDRMAKLKLNHYLSCKSTFLEYYLKNTTLITDSNYYFKNN